MQDLTSTTSQNQLTGDWIGTYKAESAGLVHVKLSFYQLDLEALAQLLKGAHQDLLAGQEIVVGIYQSTSGAIGTISGTLTGAAFSGLAQQTTPGCQAQFTMSGTVSADEFTWTFSGTDCLGPEDGTGTVKRAP